jgi:hypothetical protein
MVRVTTVGYQLPFDTIFAICSPAPMKRYQDAPNTMHAKCSKAATALSAAPATRNGLTVLTIFYAAQHLNSGAFETTAVIAVAKMGGGSNVTCSDLLGVIATLRCTLRWLDCRPTLWFTRQLSWSRGTDD